MARRRIVRSADGEPAGVTRGHRLLAAVCHGDGGLRGGAALPDRCAVPAHLVQSQRRDRPHLRRVRAHVEHGRPRLQPHLLLRFLHRPHGECRQ